MSARKKAAPRAAKTLEQTLWDAADKMRGNLEAGEYKHVVLGLVFLKYVSDAFEDRRAWLEEATANPKNKKYYITEADRRAAVVNARDEYESAGVAWVPDKARWNYLQRRTKDLEIGSVLDKAMKAIEQENPSLKGVLPKQFSRSEVDKRLLGELVDLIGTIGFTKIDHGADDVLGRVYEYFLGQFASSEGKRAGEYYTPRSIVQLLVEMLEPYKGRVYDPCCGTGGMFVQSADFVKAHGGKSKDISIFGQEFTTATWRLAKMNLAIRGIETNLGSRADDTFHNDLHPALKADFIIANPPFNVSDWYSETLRDDPRWKWGTPPGGNANYAWIQHFVHHLAPKGVAGFVLANGSLTSKGANELEIRRGLLLDDLVDCIVALPERLFLNAPIPVCLWFLAKGRGMNSSRTRDRRGSVLFIDARSMGSMASRSLRVLEQHDIEKIAITYKSWKYSDEATEYKDQLGFCRAVPVEEIAQHDFALTPGRYVGASELAEERIPSHTELKQIRQNLLDEIARSRRLQEEIETSLRKTRRD